MCNNDHATTISEIARAKVNLSLVIKERQADGYHQLFSLVAFADYGDCLTFRRASHFSFELSGPFASQIRDEPDNLVVRAYRLLHNAYPKDITPVAISLEKNLPSAAGLGGGSADAAATLRGVLRLSQHNVPLMQLKELCRHIGADVPACLASEACIMSGVGATINALELFSPLHAILVNPAIRLETRRVFSQLGLAFGQCFPSLYQTSLPPIGYNHLTTPAIKLCPEIGLVLETLKSCEQITEFGMSGSGASCFGIFPSAALSQKASQRIKALYPDWWCQSVVLS